MINADIQVVMPELLLAVFAMLALIGAVYTGKDKLAGSILWLTSAAMLGLALWIGMGDAAAHDAFGGSFTDDAFSRFAKVAVLIAGAAVMLSGQATMEKRGLLRFEYPILIALASVGMMVMVSASDLMVLYMGLELQSLSLYIVAALNRDSTKSTEAGLKYFVLGALSSGLLLYGVSLVYGYAGRTLFSGIITAANVGYVGMGLLIG
ncbi:MAG: NADH-quinone oxidoreductase subunit N, partial [Rhodobacteraceae bacterium]|nr:NADH-quinone oxidoreductase subunit N [Paracoccaceae bacterium]